MVLRRAWQRACSTKSSGKTGWKKGAGPAIRGDLSRAKTQRIHQLRDCMPLPATRTSFKKRTTKGDLDRAIAAYRQAIHLKKDDAQAHGNLGLTLQSQGQFAEALAALQLGHQLGSKKPRWRYPSARWVQRCQRLCQLDARLQAVLKGEGQPPSAKEQLALADLCQHYKKL